MCEHYSTAMASRHLPCGQHTFSLTHSLSLFKVRRATYPMVDPSKFLNHLALIVYGLLFVNPINAVWYRPDCIVGVFILFGIASYLGTYLLSNIIRRGAFAAALGIHILFFVLCFIAYIANQFGGPADARMESMQPSPSLESRIMNLLTIYSLQLPASGSCTYCARCKSCSGTIHWHEHI